MTRSVETARKISQTLSNVIFFSGCAVLTGWAFNITPLKSVFAGMVTMKANTALCFILIAVAAWRLHNKQPNQRRPEVAGTIVIYLIIGLSIATLAEYFFNCDLQIDQFLFQEPSGAILTSAPGRMAFNTAINFLLIGSALYLSMSKKTWANYLTQILALMVAVISLFSLIGYLFNAQPLFLGPRFSTAMALPATILFIFSSIGLLLLKPDQGLMAHVTCDLTGGKFLRRALPVAIICPIIIEFFKLFAEKNHLVSNEFGAALVAIGSITLLTIYIAFLSGLLNHADIKRKSLENVTISVKDRLEKIISAVADPLFVKDKDHRWILFNTAFASFMGRRPDEILNKSDHEFFPKEQADISWSKDEVVFLKGEEVINTEFFTNASGETKQIVTKKTLFCDNAGNKFIVGIISDMSAQKHIQDKVERQSRELETALNEAIKTRSIMISMLDDNNQIRKNLETHLVELKRSQNMLINSEKLASLGRLVSEMAHEVNNPLMIISGNAQLSLMDENISADERNNLEIIISECQRAKNVIRRVLRFARPSKGDIKKTDIAQSIESIVGILEKQFLVTSNIEIIRHYAAEPVLIHVDEQQIQEVFMNLLNNAKEAMTLGGTITIATMIEGDFLRIDFKDSGPGMSDDVMQKIMEPFFTTKESGTGIGLSVCYGIIKSHNGELRYDSEPGKGTTATVLLPLKAEGEPHA